MAVAQVTETKGFKNIVHSLSLELDRVKTKKLTGTLVLKVELRNGGMAKAAIAVENSNILRISP